MTGAGSLRERWSSTIEAVTHWATHFVDDPDPLDAADAVGRMVTHGEHLDDALRYAFADAFAAQGRSMATAVGDLGLVRRVVASAFNADRVANADRDGVITYHMCNTHSVAGPMGGLLGVAATRGRGSGRVRA